jgi:HlyD family secretion protein
LLKPSMTANVTFLYATRDDALRVPNSAFRFRPSQATIERMGGPGKAPALPNNLKLDERLLWVLQNAHAVPVTVRIGISDGDNTEIVGGGLHEGDRVVTAASTEANGARPGV